MPNRVYALLVGVNDYGPGIEPLDGCLNDVDLFHEYLNRHVDPAALAVEVLKNTDATRANIIGRFRSHLGRARSGDVALFQFCGHGAQWASNAAFRESFPDGKDEGLVCYDSRRPGGYDLADKELAVLIAEVARNDAHVAVLFDCCHSGSGTREVQADRGLKPRLTHEVTTERPLESYLDGHYSRLRDARQPLFVPKARHILLAACERGQLAQETPGHGLFTSTLVDVLDKSGGELSYADLFARCRAVVRSRAFDQNPQFEAYDRFDAGAGFLGRPLTRTSSGRYLVSCEQGAWIAECGAITGVPSGIEATVAFSLYPENAPTTPAGAARAARVGLQKTDIELDFESSESTRYLAEITSPPGVPTPMAFIGDDPTRAAVEAALHQHGARVSLIGARDAAYALTVGNGRLTLTSVPRNVEIGFADAVGDSLARAAAALAPSVKQVLHWERTLRLQNHRTAMDRSKVEFAYMERLDAGGEQAHDGSEATLAWTESGRPIEGRLRVRNRTEQSLFAVLVYFSEAYGVHILHNGPIPPGDNWVTVWGDGPTDNFFLADGVDESMERFKLLIATEKIDDFLLTQPALTLGDEYGATKAFESIQPPHQVAYEADWFAKDIHIRVVRRPADPDGGGRANPPA